MNDRYDFNYWPPLPMEVDQTEPIPAELEDVLCDDILYIEDSARRASVYASGDWVDIQDFWLEAKEPNDRELLADPELCNLDPSTEQPMRVATKRHLSGATFAFRKLVYEIADISLLREDEALGREEEFYDSAVYKLLFYYVFNRNISTTTDRDLLVNRQAVTEIYDGEMYLPWGLGYKSHLLIAKVALNWSAEIDAFNAGLINLKEPF